MHESTVSEVLTNAVRMYLACEPEEDTVSVEDEHGCEDDISAYSSSVILSPPAVAEAPDEDSSWLQQAEYAEQTG